MNMHGYAPRLVIMAKRPQAGQVKTRLARAIGNGRAAWFFRHMLNATMRRLAADSRWQTWIAVAPDRAIADPFWPDETYLTQQGRGDLGDRMGAVMAGLPPGPVVIIGADIPGIRTDEIARAFHALGAADAVFGPAPDGGYWLVGLKRLLRTPEIFAGVRWSSEHTLADTLANTDGLRIAKLEMRRDIDDMSDLRRVRGAGRLIPSAVADVPQDAA